MVWEQDPQCLTGTHLTTGHVVQEGYGVLDGGATKTMASIRALEQLEAKCGHQPGVGIHKLDVQETPTFGFGNSQEPLPLHMLLQDAHQREVHEPEDPCAG